MWAFFSIYTHHTPRPKSSQTFFFFLTCLTRTFPIEQMTKLLLFRPSTDEALLVSRSWLKNAVCMSNRSSRTGKICRKSSTDSTLEHVLLYFVFWIMLHSSTSVKELLLHLVQSLSVRLHFPLKAFIVHFRHYLQGPHMVKLCLVQLCGQNRPLAPHIWIQHEL